MRKLLSLAFALCLPIFAGAAEAPAIPRLPEPLKLVIAGPPGVGKGTMSELLVRDYGLVHLSVGELLRQKAAQDPQLKETLKSGRLAPPAVVNELVRERLSQPDVRARGFLLDGYPRQLAQAESFRQLLDEGRVAVDAVLALDAPHAELRRRVLGRGREDDTAETFEHRMRVYRSETIPALEALRPHAPVLPVDMSGKVEDNYARLRSAIDGVLSQRPAAR